MPLFKRTAEILQRLKMKDFKTEKDLQSLIERNLTMVFNSRFVASEYPTGVEHGGRIDTLALSEDDNPVIIEYKKVASSDLINQSLFYLAWINDHRGDFQVQVEKQLGKKTKIDWGEVRVICLAPSFRKFDLHAVRVMGADIELWQYRLFEDGSLYLEEVFRKNSRVVTATNETAVGKNPIMVAAGKKAAVSRATGVYSVEQHVMKTDKSLRKIVSSIRDFIMSLDDSVEENPKKFYVAYKVAQNFVCMEVQKKKIHLYLKLNPKNIATRFTSYNGIRDVSKIGHYGTGDLEVPIVNEAELELVKPMIKAAYEEIGG